MHSSSLQAEVCLQGESKANILEMFPVHWRANRHADSRQLRKTIQLFKEEEKGKRGVCVLMTDFLQVIKTVKSFKWWIAYNSISSLKHRIVSGWLSYWSLSEESKWEKISIYEIVDALMLPPVIPVIAKQQA